MKKVLLSGILISFLIILGACGDDAKGAEKDPKEEVEKNDVAEEPKLKENEIIVTMADGSEEVQETKEYELEHSTGSIKTIKGYSVSEDGDYLVGIDVKAKIANREYLENERKRLIRMEHNLTDDNRASAFRSSYSGGNIRGEHSPVEEGKYEHPYLNDKIIVFDRIVPENKNREVNFGINKYTEDYNQGAYISFDKGVSEKEIEEKLYEIMSMLETLPTSNGVKETVDVAIPNFKGTESNSGGEVIEVMDDNKYLVDFCDGTEHRNGACDNYVLHDEKGVADLEKGDIFVFDYKVYPDKDKYVLQEVVLKK
ncbi:hypothetical protein [Halobacillus kuroshimensis]|uniref:hypothetical protein n=1 Tax=Halobacillus kuroshimensis TaxID=302481 RepID=UPI00041E2752|nr:hypothetical protein [Halobacillus kuroshimensis]